MMHGDAGVGDKIESGVELLVMGAGAGAGRRGVWNTVWGAWAGVRSLGCVWSTASVGLMGGVIMGERGLGFCVGVR